MTRVIAAVARLVEKHAMDKLSRLRPNVKLAGSLAMVALRETTMVHLEAIRSYQ